MNVNAKNYRANKKAVNKPSARRNHRTTLPQSRPLGVPAPSEREPGTGRSLPAPSLRELSSEARLRECTSMNVNAQKFQSLYELACKSLAWSNHRTTLPQSRPLGVPAPSEREPGGVRAIQRTARKPGRFGRFSSPLRRAGSIHPTAREMASGLRLGGYRR